MKYFLECSGLKATSRALGLCLNGLGRLLLFLGNYDGALCENLSLVMNCVGRFFWISVKVFRVLGAETCEFGRGMIALILFIGGIFLI